MNLCKAISLQPQPEHLATYLLHLALDRSKALHDELQRISSYQYPSKGPSKLIELAQHTNEQITKDLINELNQAVSLSAIPSREIEITLRAKIHLLTYLLFLMQFVDGAEREHPQVNLNFPLRRLLAKHISDFDFIVRVSHRYNYVKWSLAGRIEKVFREVGYIRMLRKLNFPSQFFVIDCPICERRNIPVYCMFGHEVSHTLYENYNLKNILMPTISLDKNRVQRLIMVRARQSGLGAGQRWISEVEVRQKLWKIIEQWVEELASDALALCLFGPAYLYAFVYFVGPSATMDNQSATHPSNRMRIELMCNMLLNSRKGLSYGSVLEKTSPSCKRYIRQWQSYVKQIAVIPPSADSAYYDIATSAIKPIFEEIVLQTKAVIGKKKYGVKSYMNDVPTLLEALKRGIPPNEIVDWKTGIRRIVKAESILNAGWAYLISGDDSFAKLLDDANPWKDPCLVTNRLFSVVSLGLEYAERQRQWGK